MDALTDPQLLLLSLMTILVRKQKSSLILPTLTLYHSPAYLPVSSVHTQQHLSEISATHQKLLRS
jgi:hypothetical protein